MIAYSIITGKEPLFEGPPHKQIECIINGHQPNLSAIENEDIRAFVSRCMSKDAKDRPPIEAVIDELMSERFCSLFDANLPLVLGYLQWFENCANSIQNVDDTELKPKTPKMEFRVILVGGIHSGKTALFETFVNKEKTLETYPTIEASFSQVSIQTDSGEVKLCLTDTTGYDGFRVLLPSLVRTASAVVFLTDVNSSGEFRQLADFIRIVQKNSESARRYLAVTKCDMEWKNTKEELQSFASKNRMELFMTSCDDIASIEGMFACIAADLVAESK